VGPESILTGRTARVLLESEIMIRAQTDNGWILVNHRDHALLASKFARVWGNERFDRPEPFGDIDFAVAHHDDGWIARDATPTLTKDGKPEAFTRALVGAYSAFEEIDLPSYLRVRGDATALVASQNPYAGILVSMHTVNLLTEQADLSSIRAEHRPAFDQFIGQQRAWQKDMALQLHASPESLQRGFEFLQCCDNLSLIACSGYESARDLRHQHPDRTGAKHTLRVSLAGANTWNISPWPFAQTRHEFSFPYRKILSADCATVETLRVASGLAEVKHLHFTLVAGS